MLELSKKYLNIDNNDLNRDDLENLQKIIEYHSDLYYNKESPIISDNEYDILFKKLEFLEDKYNPNYKQTLRVWAEIIESSFEKVKHSRPMISLDNTYNELDLRDFNDRVIKNIDNEKINNVSYTLEYKFDWLWIELIYKKWELVQAITRWNGNEWEDVTQNIFCIDNIPKYIDYKDHLEVRWEVVMPISSFELLNRKAKEENKKVFSNPRNAASWSVRTKDIKVTKERNLKFYAYDLANFDEFRQKENISTYYDVILDLEKLWFEISSYFEVFDSIEWVINSIDTIDSFKKDIDFEIDGLVIKVNSIDLWSDIWWTAHHPRYAIAYKFPAEIFTTQILSVDHSVWRTWTITPVANLEAINIWWVIVKRATLHNYDEIEKLWVRLGDYVFIKRAWEVIPKITWVVDDLEFVTFNWKKLNRKDLEKISTPEFCPSCKTLVKKDEDKVRYYCPNNIDCPAKHSEMLTYSVWKSWFNIDWFWERQVELFLELGIINNLVDIFNIKDKKDIILSLEWYKEKSVNNLIEWVEKAKNVDITTFLSAIWIPWVGKKTAKIISRFFIDKNSILDFSLLEEDLISLNDIWPELAKNIVNYFNSDAHKKILTQLIDILNIKYYEHININTNSFFNNKKVCITWSFELDWQKVSRDSLVEKLEKSGWEFVSSVTKKTDFLLAWEKAWSKLKKANELNVEVIDLDNFLKNL